jgi:hypothetical protein
MKTSCCRVAQEVNEQRERRWNPLTLDLSLNSGSIEEEERSRIVSQLMNTSIPTGAYQGEFYLYQDDQDELHIKFQQTEPQHPEQNWVEGGSIRELRKRWFCLVMLKNAPKRLSEFVIVFCADVTQCSTNSIYSLHGCTPVEILQVTLQTCRSILPLVASYGC